MSSSPIIIVKKTIVLDMDETLIKATLNLKQVPNFNAMATLYREKGPNGNGV